MKTIKMSASEFVGICPLCKGEVIAEATGKGVCNSCGKTFKEDDMEFSI